MVDVTLGDPTVIVGLGDTIDVITLGNPSVVVIALDTSTAEVKVAFTTMLEDCATELLPNKVQCKKITSII